MQKNPNISLNAVRVFESVARLQSMKAAGSELFVTAGAVSHQIKQLEDALGVALFHRKNNGIRLTPAGLQFFTDIQPSIVNIDNAASALMTDANELSLQVSSSLAVRWLIQRLEDFKKRYPQTRIKLETTQYAELALGANTDIAITYYPLFSTQTEGKLLIEDHCLPLVSPKLLTQHRYSEIVDCEKIPALSCSVGDWDWEIWCKAHGLSKDDINIIDQFDTDDSAIHAAASGLGMVLMSTLLAKNEITTGALVPLPKAAALILGSYRIIRSTNSNALADKFEAWLLDIAP